MQSQQPLILVSSRTGNTRKLAQALAEVIVPRAALTTPELLPEDLTPFNPVLLGFWCDRGMAPVDIQQAAKRLHGKRIGCFATMGGEPEKPEAQRWIQETAEALVGLGQDNTLVATFLSMGRVDPEVFRRVTEMVGYLSPEREARRKRAESHPDENDARALIERFQQAGLI